MKMLLTALAMMLSVSIVACQDLLDIEKNKDAELFVVKKGYDVQQRLKEIVSIVGKDVTVYNGYRSRSFCYLHPTQGKLTSLADRFINEL